LTCVNF